MLLDFFGGHRSIRLDMEALITLIWTWTSFFSILLVIVFVVYFIRDNMKF